MSTFLDNFIITSPPISFYTAIVAIAVLGHKQLQPIPYYSNSLAQPNDNIDIPYFPIE